MTTETVFKYRCYLIFWITSKAAYSWLLINLQSDVQRHVDLWEVQLAESLSALNQLMMNKTTDG